MAPDISTLAYGGRRINKIAMLTLIRRSCRRPPHCARNRGRNYLIEARQLGFPAIICFCRGPGSARHHRPPIAVPQQIDDIPRELLCVVRSEDTFRGGADRAPPSSRRSDTR